MPRRSILLFAGACVAIAAALIAVTLVLVNRPAVVIDQLERAADVSLAGR